MLFAELNQAGSWLGRVAAHLCAIVLCLFLVLQWASDAVGDDEYATRVESPRYEKRVEFETEGRSFSHRVMGLGVYALEHPDKAELLADIRDVNACWLLMQAREFRKFAISYTLEENIVGKPSREYPYTGPYDRGIRFRPPSEWILYYVHPALLTFSETDEGLILISYTNPEPEPPPFARELALWPRSMPEIWHQRLSYSLWPCRSPDMLVCEVLVDPVSYRVVSERLTTTYWRYFCTCEYSYDEGSFPTSFRVTGGGREPLGNLAGAIDALCCEIDGFWFIRSYARRSLRDEGTEETRVTVSVNDITVTKM